MTRVFISYRRADGGHAAGRFHDHLAESFGDENVFLDVESLPLGTDFRQAIRDTIGQVDTVLVLVGPNFAPDQLARPHDMVRMEIRTAFDLNRQVIPVLIEGAEIPPPSDLPPELAEFSYLNAAVVGTGPNFRPDLARLIGTLDRNTGTEPDRARPVPFPHFASPPRRTIKTGHRSDVLSIAYAPDGLVLATTSWDRTIRLWDAASGTQIRRIKTPTVQTAIAFDVNRTNLLSGRRDTVTRWDVTTGNLLAEPAIAHAGGDTIYFSPDGKLTATRDLRRELNVQSTESGRVRPTLGPVPPVTAAAFSPDGALFACTCRVESSNQGILALWHVSERRQVWRGDLGPERWRRADALTFSPDGKTIATGDDVGRVRLWDAGSGRHIRAVDQWHHGRVLALAFVADGQVIASGGVDNTVRLWDVATGRHITYLGHGETVAFAVSPTTGELASLGRASRWRIGGVPIRIWDLSGLV